MGIGTTCADVNQVGACCLPDGSCEDIPRCECLSKNGTFMGSGTACASINQVGACCLPDDSCEEITQCECLRSDGSYKGIGVSCDDVECVEGGFGNCFESTGLFFCCILYGLLLAAISAFIVLIVAAFCPSPPNTTLVVAAGATLAGIALILTLLAALCSWSFCRVLRAAIWIFEWTAIACLVAYFFCMSGALLIAALVLGVIAGLLFLIKPSCGWPKLLQLP